MKMFQRITVVMVTQLCEYTKKTLNCTFYLFFIFYNKFIYLFLALLGLCCCTRDFSSCGEWGLLFVAVPGLLIAVASLVVEHGL